MHGESKGMLFMTKGAKVKEEAIEVFARAELKEKPAWEGCTALPANLILEGGAMRGLFTAGVLDVFMEHGLCFERVIGVSAGALHGYNYVAGAYGRSLCINVNYCDDWRYLSMRSYCLTGNACGREFCFDAIPNEIVPFHYDFFNESPMRLISVASNLETGEANYYEHDDAIEGLDHLIASSSMPLVSRIVEFEGKKLLDGGTCDSIPLNYSMLTGARKHVVVRTLTADYVRKPSKLGTLMSRTYANYPYYVQRAAYRHIDYNRCARDLVRRHEAGEIFMIAPEVAPAVASMEKDPEKLMVLYKQGRARALSVLPALKKYLEIS